MNGLFVIIIFATILYFIYKKFKIKIYSDETYKIGVIKNDNVIKQYGSLIKELSDLNIEILLYDNYDILMKEVNNNKVHYGITYENYFIDSVLGLNSYEGKVLKNINFCSGLYFNYFQYLV